MWKLIWNNIAKRKNQSLLTIAITMLTIMSFVLVLGVFVAMGQGLELSKQRLGADVIFLPEEVDADGYELLFTSQPETHYMDYSIYDALEAGFDKIVFIIRKDLEADFREIIGNRIEKVCPVAYAFQEKENLPAGYTCPAERKKPWGTGQAVLSCKGIVNEPFLVINADDYYGKEGFRLAHDFLVENAGKAGKFCMPGFILKNTLSENGVYGFVGDLSALQANYPEGEGIVIKWDDLSEAEDDLVKVVGRQYVGYGITAPGKLCKLTVPGA